MVRFWRMRMRLALFIIGKKTAFMLNANIDRDGAVYTPTGWNSYYHGCLHGKDLTFVREFRNRGKVK